MWALLTGKKIDKIKVDGLLVYVVHVDNFRIGEEVVRLLLLLTSVFYFAQRNVTFQDHYRKYCLPIIMSLTVLE